MRKRIWDRYSTIVIAPPHPKQTKKIAAPWQIELLNVRSKIESVFDYLKEYLHLVSSFPRSMNGTLCITCASCFRSRPDCHFFEHGVLLEEHRWRDSYLNGFR